MKSVLQLLALVALVAACDACSCLPNSLPKQYYSPSYTRVVRAVIKAEQRPSCSSGSFDCNVLYRIQVMQAFKGCLSPTNLTVSTADNSGLCGISLTVGTEYLLLLSSDSVPRVGLCQGIQPYSTVTAADRKFLETRKVCCNGQCKCSAKYPLVNCVLEPCRVSKAPCSEAVKCVNSYCGGSNAEWFTKDNYTACLPVVPF
jgi:hypothetical protein